MAIIVYCDELELKTMLSRLTITLLLMTSVTFDVPKVATSVCELGTVGGVQFAAVFQSPLVGFVAHVALPAKAGVKQSSSAKRKTEMNEIDFTEQPLLRRSL